MARPNTSAIIAAITTKASIAIAAMPPIGKRSSEDEGSVISGVVAMRIDEQARYRQGPTRHSYAHAQYTLRV